MRSVILKGGAFDHGGIPLWRRWPGGGGVFFISVARLAALVPVMEPGTDAAGRALGRLRRGEALGEHAGRGGWSAGDAGWLRRPGGHHRVHAEVAARLVAQTEDRSRDDSSA